MTRSHTFIDSPIDPIVLVAEDGKLCGLYMEKHKHHPEFDTFGDRNDKLFAQIIEELEQYFNKERTTFDVELAPVGSAFQHSVWNALREIPYGKTWSYGQLANHIGKPGAARVVGQVNGQNPISIIVPCHRVIGASGKLVGYGGGLHRKEYLLGLEKAANTPKLDAQKLFV